MSENPTDAIVDTILKDLTTGSTSTGEVSGYAFHRAVSALRTTACTGDHPISPTARRKLDDAIRAAQPLIVAGDVPARIRFTVGALHVITAEWANPDRQPVAQVPPLVLEAFMLARLLDNWLIDGIMINALARHRAAMDDVQRSSLRLLVDDLYPFQPQEPAPFHSVSVH